MNTNHKQTIVETTKAFLQNRTDFTQADLAKKIGYSTATLSQVLSSTYAGDDTSVLLKLVSELGIELNQKWKIKETATVRTIQNICLEAQEDSRMMALTANTGLGKTTALLNYVKNKTSKNAFYVLATILMKPKDLLTAILTDLGIEYEGTMSAMLDKIVSHLSQLDHPFLVIDDAGKLMEHPKCYFIIQLLYDRLEGRVGILCAGMPIFKEFIRKMVVKNKNGFPELARRFSYWENISRIDARFIPVACSDFGITEEPAIKLIAEKCKNYGDIKNMLLCFSKYASQNEVLPGMQRKVLTDLHIQFLTKEVA
jgi:hypothetical protein